jgi:hypothetical protein
MAGASPHELRDVRGGLLLLYSTGGKRKEALVEPGQRQESRIRCRDDREKSSFVPFTDGLDGSVSPILTVAGPEHKRSLELILRMSRGVALVVYP